MSEEAKPARKQSDQAVKIRRQAKVAATGEGKEWGALSRDERKGYIEKARDGLKEVARKAKRVAAKATA